MKKYISADLRVINIYANDIIATSDPSFGEDYNEGNHSAKTGERHVWDEF